MEYINSDYFLKIAIKKLIAKKSEMQFILLTYA